MAAAVTLTLRFSAPGGAKVERVRFATLDEALGELERRLRDLGRDARQQAIDLRVRRFEPAQQIAARGELRTGRVRAGVDLRGDGSFQAFTGRLRRAPVDEEAQESAFAALRRVLREDPPTTRRGRGGA